ncbi:MAG: hypothetical protein ABSH32_10105 [Bryobacteraceae bacterium]
MKLLVVVYEPLAVVIVTGPVVAPGGTVTWTERTEVARKLVAGVPLKTTDLAPSR